MPWSGLSRATEMLLAAAIAIIFLAAIVRGYSGFGFSLLAITALSLLYPPAVIIPSVFLLEIAASLHLLPGLWRDIHWRSLLPLVIGTTIGTPLGLMFLTGIPPAPMQIALGLFVFVVTYSAVAGLCPENHAGKCRQHGCRPGAGVANGAFGIGGPPVILFYFASPAGAIVGRATLVTYFLLTDAIGLVFLSRENLISTDTIFRTLTFLPALLAGVWLGARSFKNADPVVFRKWVLALLALLAAISAAKGILRPLTSLSSPARRSSIYTNFSFSALALARTGKVAVASATDGWGPLSQRGKAPSVPRRKRTRHLPSPRAGEGWYPP